MVTGALGLALLPGTAVAARMATPGDFNGDGYRDLVLSAPWTTVSGHRGAGAVVVLYGSASGVSPTKRVVITQNSAGVPGASEKGDGFGTSTAVADLNLDGYADLVVGTPREDLASGTDVGMVSVLWGSRSGLGAGTNLNPPQSLPSGVYFGLSVAAVKGSSGATTKVMAASWSGVAEYTGPFSRTGTVGSTYGNTASASAGAVALGDVDRSGDADRFIFTVRVGDTGAQVHVNSDDSMWPRPVLSQGDGVTGTVGDVNGDGYGDLVVGDPDEPGASGPEDEGAVGGRVSVWFGSATGIALDAKPQHISQDTVGVPGAGEKYDEFGATVAVADLNRDGAAEIIVGAPKETLGEDGSAGNVVVIPGRKTGLLGTGAYAVNQETASVAGGSEDEDQFGTTVEAGDLNKDGRPELMVTGVGENNYQGAVWVLSGGATGPTGTGSKMMLPSALGISQSDAVALGGTGEAFIG
ncbi:VCBS repeat-containing protein [Streptomyces mesophilus]|uniref:VCBS repeat-containing protein n=1 Tax=Streptomyces mesophilus TaxID=1775132 RepID=UPI002E2C5336|nr:VCBS repeat-containing protein [Streptomyces mesophilus]